MRRQDILYYALFILTYIALYFTTSLYLMTYEDFWDDSKGQIWSLETMNVQEKIAYITWFLPNFPLGLIFSDGLLKLISVCIIDPVIIGWALLKVFNKHRDRVIKYGIIANAVITTLVLMALLYLFL
jgi:hypothetical protein